MGSMAPFLTLLLLGYAELSTTATECTTNTPNFIQTSDIVTDIHSIATNSLNQPLSNPVDIEASQAKRIAFPTTTFCIQNDYLYEKTLIKISDITSGANAIVSQCCNGATCQGGSYTITGSLGVKVILSIQPGGTSCVNL
ncbi:unnamed protein product [Calypogeia fissa]